MDRNSIEPVRFLGVTLLLNGVLAGARLLASDGASVLNGLTAVFVALIFGLAAYLVHDSVREGALIPAIGGVILLTWLNGLPLWGTWLWGLALGSVLIPLLMIASVQLASSDQVRGVVLIAFSLLAGIWWLSWTAVPDSEWWHWLILFLGLFGLLWGWLWHTQSMQTIGLYLAVAFICLLQIGIVAFLLPFSTSTNGAFFALLFGLICASCVWPDKQKAASSTTA